MTKPWFCQIHYIHFILFAIEIGLHREFSNIKLLDIVKNTIHTMITFHTAISRKEYLIRW